MPKILIEGWAAQDHKQRTASANAESHAAHILTVAAEKHPHLHQQAAQAHDRARWAHIEVASASTSDDQAGSHEAASHEHESASKAHWDAHNAHRGDLNFATDKHKKNLASTVKVSKEYIKRNHTLTEDYMPASTEVRSLVSKIIGGNHVDAASDFDTLVQGRLDMKLNDRTKELAAQVFGPGITLEEVEPEIELEDPDDDDEVAAHLQSLADDTLGELEEEADGEDIDLDEFIESFNETLAEKRPDLAEKYALWRPEEHGAVKSGRISDVKVKRLAKKKAESRASDPRRQKGTVKEEVEQITELKARTLRHYVGHAQKQIKSAQGEIKKATAQGKSEVVKHFQDRVAKRKAGIKTVLGKQKSAAEKRAASAKAKAAEAGKQSAALDKEPAKKKTA